MYTGKWFKIVVYIMLASIVLSTVLLSASYFLN